MEDGVVTPFRTPGFAAEGLGDKDRSVFGAC